MTAFLIFGVLAAFGALAMLWALLGFLLPVQRGTAMVHVCRGRQEAAVRRWGWLRDLGLVRCPLILIDCPLCDRERLAGYRHGITFCDLAELGARLEQERDGLG